MVYGNDYQHGMELVLGILYMFVILHMHIPGLNYLQKMKTSNPMRSVQPGNRQWCYRTGSIKAFEKVSGVKLNYEIGPRRPGDVIAIYANNDKAKNILGWDPIYNLDDMMTTAWKWEQR